MKNFTRRQKLTVQKGSYSGKSQRFYSSKNDVWFLIQGLYQKWPKVAKNQIPSKLNTVITMIVRHIDNLAFHILVIEFVSSINRHLSCLKRENLTPERQVRQVCSTQFIALECTQIFVKISFFLDLKALFKACAQELRVCRS